MAYIKEIIHRFSCDRCGKQDLPYQESNGQVQPKGNLVKHLDYQLVLDNVYKQKKDLLLCEECAIAFNEFMGDI